MAYSDFTLNKIREQLGVENRRIKILTDFAPVVASDNLEEVEELPIRSEKAKSEWIVVPILKELRNRKCDFILAKDIGTFDINYPIIQIVEAKKNDVELGVPQCAAQLIGAKIYNEKKGVQLDKIYGCVTTGNEWLFMEFEDDCIKINTKLYYLNEIDNILGIFQWIINYYVNELK